jgi:acyl-coenzyme A thioesterase PaaI-like protein
MVDDAAAEQMNRWLGIDLERGEQREAVHRIAEGLRTVARELVRVDAETAALTDLLVVEDAVRQLQDQIVALPQLETTPASAPLPASYLTERSPVTGATNPVAPPLRMRFGATTTAHVVYAEQYEGPAGGVHGGIVAASFDELLGVAQMAAGVAGYTGTLEVRYRRVTPLHTLITYEAGVDRLEGRRLHMWARSTADGDVLAEATGIFVIREELPVPSTR